MQETLSVFGHNEKISNKMLIIGGGNIGFNLAKNIEQSFESARVKIIEKDKSRAEYIANELNDTIVINGNGLDEEVLNEAINGNIEPFNKFLEILNKPYLEQKDTINYQTPLYSNEKYQTFCGT